MSLSENMLLLALENTLNILPRYWASYYHTYWWPKVNSKRGYLHNFSFYGTSIIYGGFINVVLEYICVLLWFNFPTLLFFSYNLKASQPLHIFDCLKWDEHWLAFLQPFVWLQTSLYGIVFHLFTESNCNWDF